MLKKLSSCMNNTCRFDAAARRRHLQQRHRRLCAERGVAGLGLGFIGFRV